MMSLAVVCFAILDSVSKYLSRYYPVPFVIWARYVVHTVLMLFVFGPRMRLALVKTSRPGGQFLRAVSLVATSLLFVSGLSYLPLAEATAIMFLTPIFVTALSALLLKEKAGVAEWVAVVTGFVGVLIIVRPGGAMLTFAVLLPVAGAATNSLYQIMTRKFSGSESSTTTNFIVGLVGTLLMSLALPWYWRTPGLWHIVVILAMGTAATCGHYLLFRAFTRASPALLGPFGYLQLLWAALIGYLMFGDLPKATDWMGMGVIAASGLAVTYLHLYRTPKMG